MSEPEKKEAPEPAPKKSSGGVVGLLLPAIVAGGAAFGAVKFGGAGAHAATAETGHHIAPKPPGPTVPLEPFLVMATDSNKKVHPMKISLAIEFDATVKEDAIKPFIPRIRDGILAHLRATQFEDVVDSAKSEKVRSDLLERVRATGALAAERILITDLVSQ